MSTRRNLDHGNLRVKLVALLQQVTLALLLVGCDNGDQARKRMLQYDLQQMTSWASEGSSDGVRSRAKAGLILLQNGMDDEAPFIIKADVAYEDVDAVKEGGKGPILGVHFISEVYAEGILEVSDRKGGWVRKVVGDEQPRKKYERSLRAIVIPIAALPLNGGSQITGVELRVSIRGKTSNVVTVERIIPGQH